MDELIPFNYEGTDIRTIARDGEPWWIASDVAHILGYRDAHNLVRGLDEDEKGTHILSTPYGDQEMTIISEAGLYSAILKSRVERAREFKRWITHEVIPAIHRHGGYLTPQKVEEALL